eukprot:1022109-Rhodomonas_salina.2
MPTLRTGSGIGALMISIPFPGSGKRAPVRFPQTWGASVEANQRVRPQQADVLAVAARSTSARASANRPALDRSASFNKAVTRQGSNDSIGADRQSRRNSSG